MKTRSIFHVSVFIMIVLVFSMPFITFAQQYDDSDFAILHAERDAKNDVNESKWFLTGCLGGALVVIAISISEQDSIAEPVGGLLGTCRLAGLGFLTGYAILHSPSPPPERLLGKSPEYVVSYVNTYVNRVKLRRTLSSTAGCIGGYFGMFVIAVSQEWIYYYFW